MRINRTRRSQGLPHLAQLVEHLTVVGKNNVSADIRGSPVQVREWGPLLSLELFYDVVILIHVKNDEILYVVFLVIFQRFN